MTPKQKAESLLRHMTVDFSIDLWQSKQCALVAVNEIIELCKKYDTFTVFWVNQLPYWEEVKQELEKI